MLLITEVTEKTFAFLHVVVQYFCISPNIYILNSTFLLRFPCKYDLVFMSISI